MTLLVDGVLACRYLVNWRLRVPVLHIVRAMLSARRIHIRFGVVNGAMASAVRSRVFLRTWVVGRGENVHQRDTRGGDIGSAVGLGNIAASLMEMRSYTFRDGAPTPVLRWCLTFGLLLVALFVSKEDITVHVRACVAVVSLADLPTYLREKVLSQTEQR
jgi:hypothetical protein